MKEIKKITIEDCVECYVNAVKKPRKDDVKRYIAYKTIHDSYVDNEGDYWAYAIPCEILDNPPRPKWSDKYPKEWNIHAKVFKAISEGAVIKNKNANTIYSNWHTDIETYNWLICTNYTGTESDVWEEIE